MKLISIICGVAILLNLLHSGAAIVGGQTAAIPPLDDPVVFVRYVERYARVEGLKNRETGLYTFKGIRYADAPTGPYRFQRPRFKRLVGDINATRNGSPCPQPDIKFPGMVIGSEDCLLLNIFTPKMPDETTGLPVILWIHGGGFRYGSAAQYGAEPIIQNDVIFVPVQYRLGTLGFLGDGSRDFSNNLSMLDITCALRWITDYISFFGGDPKQIKVVGHGTGAQSAMYLSTSSMKRSSINGVMAMSGSSLSQFSYDDQPVNTLEEIVTVNDCPSTNETEIIECLRNKSIEEIINNDSKLQIERLAGEQLLRALSGNLGMSPVIEKKDDYRDLPGVITDTPNNTLSSGTFEKIPLLIGVVKDETANGIDVKKIEHFFNDPMKFLQEAAKKFSHKSLGTIKIPDLSDSFNLNSYVQIPKSWDVTKVFKKLVEVSTDALFNLPAILTAQSWSKLSETYFYSFEHKSRVAKGSYFLKGLPLVNGTSVNQDAVAHGDELGILFETRDVYGNLIPDAQISSEEDLKARKAFIKLITKFAYMNSTSQTEKETIFTPFSTKGTPYLKIGQDLEMKNDFRFCQMRLWGAQLESLKTISCKFLSEGLEGVQNVLSGVVRKPKKIFDKIVTTFG